MASYIGNKEIVSMYLGNSNVASFSFGSQEIWTPGGGGDSDRVPASPPWIEFNSAEQFEIVSYPSQYAISGWNGTMEYYDFSNGWQTWNGDTIYSQYSNIDPTGQSIDGKYYLFIRGTNNTTLNINNLSGTSGKEVWKITGTDVSCYGNIENLLDYKLTQQGKHPTVGNYAFRSLFRGNSSLITCPWIGCIDLSGTQCCGNIIRECTNLTVLPTIYAKTFNGPQTFNYGFNNTKCNVSQTRVGQYTLEYKVPYVNESEVINTIGQSAFNGTQGTYTGSLNSNTTYYLATPIMTPNGIVYPPEPTSWSINYSLAGCYSSNTSVEVDKNASYNTTIYPNSTEDLSMAEVIITMGGTDITAQCYSYDNITNTSTISVAEVTGNLDISVIIEPAVINTTLQGFIDSDLPTYSVKYHFTATVSSINSTTNGRLLLTDGVNDLDVIGSTASLNALSYNINTLQYVFTNPNNFSSDPLTSSIQVGDTIEVEFIKYQSASSSGGNGRGIILNVQHNTQPEPTLKEFIGFAELDSSALNIPSQTPATIIIDYYDPKDIDNPILTIDNYGDIELSVVSYDGDEYIGNLGYVYDFDFEYNGSIYNAVGYLASDLNSFTLLGIYEGDWNTNLLDTNPVEFIPESPEE